MSEPSEQILPEELAPVVDEEAVQLDEAQPDSLDSQAEEAVAEEVEEAEPAPAAPEPEVDPVEEFRKQMSSLPGEWYVLHTYSGYERRVAADIAARAENFEIEDYVFDAVVPMETVIEIKNAGKKKEVSRVRIPGYVFVRMDLDDPETSDKVWRTPGGRERQGVLGRSGLRGRFRGGRVRHRHRWPLRIPPGHHCRDPSRDPEAPGAHLAIRPRHSGRAVLLPGRQDLRR